MASTERARTATTGTGGPTAESTPTPRRARSTRGRAGALVLVVAVVAALVVLRPWTDTPPARGSAADGRPAASAASTGPTASAAVPTVEAAPARRATSVLQPEAPTSSVLPSGKRVPVDAVSTRADGQLDVPDNIRRAGWWRGGSKLGDPFGATLLAAHVDSTTQGLGPYAELLDARPHQRVRLSSPHLSQTFEVRSLRLVPRTSLDREQQIFAAGGARRLTLVTCAPPYVKSRGGYQNLVLLTADPVGEPVRR